MTRGDCQHGYRTAGGSFDCPACEAERLLDAALDGHEPEDRTFTRGEMADLEAARAALKSLKTGKETTDGH